MIALVGIADDEAAGVEGNFRVEALHVLPVHGREHLEAVLHALDRVARDAQHRGRLAAADLRAGGTSHERVVAGKGGGLEQHVAGGHDACAAAAGEDDGNAARSLPRARAVSLLHRGIVDKTQRRRRAAAGRGIYGLILGPSDASCAKPGAPSVVPVGENSR